MDANMVARNMAMIRSDINEVERELKELEQKVDDAAVKMYKHLSESQLDSLRLTQLIDDVNSIQSSIRYATRSVAAAAGTALFGILVAIVTSGTGIELGG